MSENKHNHYINLALDLARAGLGRVAPNPSVGCVIVKDSDIVGQGRTADSGRPHAEVIALQEAGQRARGADVYVTLEPCSHTGKTEPCAQALIEAGVARVIVSMQDPDPRVSGRGLQMLKQAGIDIIEGIGAKQAYALNEGFFLSVTDKRPLVTLKMAVSSDHKIAGTAGERRAISGAEANTYIHKHLRATHDAILVGKNTAINDNPELTTRAEGLQHTLKRIVLGDKGDLPAGHTLARAEDIIFMSQSDIKLLLRDIAVDHGVTRLLVEGGANVMRRFLDSELWDQLYICKSSHAIGEGIDAPIFEFNDYHHIETKPLGDDVLSVYRRSPCLQD